MIHKPKRFFEFVEVNFLKSNTKLIKFSILPYNLYIFTVPKKKL